MYDAFDWNMLALIDSTINWDALPDVSHLLEDDERKD